MKQFWSILDFLLNKRGLTHKLFTKECEIPLSTFTRWKNKNKLPTAKSLLKMSEVLGVSIDFLLKGEEPDNLTLRIIMAYPELIRIVNKLSRNPEYIAPVIGYIEGRVDSENK